MATISPLRRRMIEDMTIRNLSRSTQQSYIYAVAKFSRHFGRSPICWEWRKCEPTSCISSSGSIRGRTSIRWHARCGFSTALRSVRRRHCSGSSPARARWRVQFQPRRQARGDGVFRWHSPHLGRQQRMHLRYHRLYLLCVSQAGVNETAKAHKPIKVRTFWIRPDLPSLDPRFYLRSLMISPLLALTK
jgi:hypothetical protein